MTRACAGCTPKEELADVAKQGGKLRADFKSVEAQLGRLARVSNMHGHMLAALAGESAEQHSAAMRLQRMLAQECQVIAQRQECAAADLAAAQRSIDELHGDVSAEILPVRPQDTYACMIPNNLPLCMVRLSFNTEKCTLALLSHRDVTTNSLLLHDCLWMCRTCRELLRHCRQSMPRSARPSAPSLQILSQSALACRAASTLPMR